MNSDEWKKAFHDLNKKYVQVVAQRQQDAQNHQTELDALKANLQEAIDLIRPYTGFVSTIEIDPQVRDNLPEYLQSIYNDLPEGSHKLMLFCEKWGFKW